MLWNCLPFVKLAAVPLSAPPPPLAASTMAPPNVLPEAAATEEEEGGEEREAEEREGVFRFKLLLTNSSGGRLTKSCVVDIFCVKPRVSH